MPTSSTEAATPAPPAPGLTRRLLVAEVLVVFALTLGYDGVRSLVDLIADLTQPVSLNHLAVAIDTTKSPGRPTLDLVYQVLGIAGGLVPVALASYLLHRSQESLATIGLDRTRPRFDAVGGAVLAALVGGTGLAFYLVVHGLGIDLTVVPENLPAVWWRIPVLLLSALQNAAIEETLVLGYLLHRLEQLGWSPARAVVVSAVVRGSYHLYQGFGGFAGNAVMGLLFGYLWHRWRRAAPMLVAHFLIDAVTFIGYAELVGKVSWLPH